MSVEEWVDRIIAETKDDEPKNPETCHEFAIRCLTLYPSNN
ncbi:hypothetical protein SIPHO063v1_p0082 [Vibrio phage PS10B.1]|nr:hypothetical protein SIPHO063v1_p0082 [Vibrio phage PS10B.1]